MRTGDHNCVTSARLQRSNGRHMACGAAKVKEMRALPAKTRPIAAKVCVKGLENANVLPEWRKTKG